MKYLKPLIFLLSIWGASAACAKPTYVEARRLYDSFQPTVSASMLWSKKSPVERSQLLKAAISLRARMESAMGPTSQCAGAATFHVELISNMNAIASAGEGVGSFTTFSMLGALANAEAFGSKRAACYDEVEALDIKR